MYFTINAKHSPEDTALLQRWETFMARQHCERVHWRDSRCFSAPCPISELIDGLLVVTNRQTLEDYMANHDGDTVYSIDKRTL